MTQTPDSSSGNNPGTLVGSQAFIASPWGSFGNALSLNGTSDGVNAGPPSGGGPPAVSGAGQPFTLEVKIKLTSISANPIVCGWDNGSIAPLAFLINLGDEGRLSVFAYDLTDTQQILNGVTVLSMDTKYDVAVDYDGTTMRLYLNGSVESSMALTGLAPWSTQDFVIGYEQVDANYVHGIIDEVRWSNVARYAGAYTPVRAPFTPDANTKALYHLDSNTGGTIVDSASPPHNGTVVGSPTLVASPWGSFGNAIQQASGVGAYIDCPGVPNAGLSPNFTLEAKAQLLSSPSPQAICGWYTGGSAPRFYLASSYDAGLTYAYITDGSDTNQSISGSPSIVDGDPHDVAMDFDGTTWRLYVDGSVIASSALSGLWVPSGNFQISNAVSPAAVDGDAVIDEVRVSSVARYAGAYTPATAPFANDGDTIALYHLDGPVEASTTAFFGMM